MSVDPRIVNIIDSVNILMEEKNALIEEKNKSSKFERHTFKLHSIEEPEDIKYIKVKLKQYDWNVYEVVESLSNNIKTSYALQEMKIKIEESGMLKGRVKINFKDWLRLYDVDRFKYPWESHDKENSILLNKTLVQTLKDKALDVDKAINDFKQHIDEAARYENEGDSHWKTHDIKEAHKAYSSANHIDSNLRREWKVREMQARLDSPWSGLKCETKGCENKYYMGFKGKSNRGWWTPENERMEESYGCQGGCGLVYRELCPQCANRSDKIELEMFKGDSRSGGKLMRNKRRKTNKKTKKRSKNSKIKSKRKKSKKNKYKNKVK